MFIQSGVSKVKNGNNLKWLCFSGLTEDYPIWCTRFQAFAQIRSLFDTLTGDDRPPAQSARLGNAATDETRAAHDAAQEGHRHGVDDIEKRKNTLWSYLAMVRDSTSLMLIRHNCIDRKDVGDGHKAWGLLHERFRSKETVFAVSVMRQQARWMLKEDEALHNYFIRARELSNRLEQAWNIYQSHCSMRWYSMAYLSAMSTSWCKSFNPADSFVELGTLLTIYEESRLQRESVDDVNSHMVMTSK